MKNFSQIIKFCSEHSQGKVIEIEKFSDEIYFLQTIYSKYQKEYEYLKFYARADTDKLFAFQQKIIHFIENHSEDFSITKYNKTIHPMISILDFMFYLNLKNFLTPVNITKLIIFDKK